MSVKISELPDAELPLDGGETLPLVQRVRDEFGDPTETLETRKAPLSLFPTIETGTFQMDVRLGFDVQTTLDFRYIKISSGAEAIVYLSALNSRFIDVIAPDEGGQVVIRHLPEDLRPISFDVNALSAGAYFRLYDQENERNNVFRTTVFTNGEIRLYYAAPDLNGNESWQPVEVYDGGFFAIESTWFISYPVVLAGTGG